MLNNLCCVPCKYICTYVSQRLMIKLEKKIEGGGGYLCKNVLTVLKQFCYFQSIGLQK